MAKNKITIKTEVVNGKCPDCRQDTILVSVVPEFYKCSLCGSDLKQHINGKIVYIPAIQLTDKERAELTSKDGQTKF